MKHEVVAVDPLTGPRWMRGWGMTRNIGMILLAIFLILTALIDFGAVAISAVVMGVIALFAAAFILVGR